MAAGVGKAHLSCELECLTSSGIFSPTARSKSFFESRPRPRVTHQAIHRSQDLVDGLQLDSAKVTPSNTRGRPPNPRLQRTRSAAAPLSFRTLGGRKD
jgi:hypothetical protein